MHKITAYWIGKLGLLLLILGGCSSPEPKPTPVFTEKEKSEAADFILAKELRLQEIVSACESMGEQPRLMSEAIQKAWWTENWSFIAASNQLYLENMKKKLNLRGKVDGQLDALKFKMEAAEENGARISVKIAHMNARAHTCHRYLRPYDSKEKRDQLIDPYRLILQSLLSDYPHVANSKPQAVLDFPTEFSASRKIGRSFYEVEQKAKKSLYCVDPLVLGLYNSWPREVFGIYCEGSAPVSVRCIWGECDFQALNH